MLSSIHGSAHCSLAILSFINSSAHCSGCVVVGPSAMAATGVLLAMESKTSVTLTYVVQSLELLYCYDCE